ncbi:MAG: LysM peptidoglycan-binding domain-containing protein, partial [Nitrospirae bacterium]|nr:LysM peptidoglycan-binding domain-containing protein [Nitrospirota bacterium]
KKSDKKSAVETVAKKTEKTVSEHKKPSDAAKKPEKTTSDTKKSDKKPVVEAVAKTTDKPEAEHKKPSDTAKKPEDKRAAIRQHKVTSGQSLVTIAKMYNISVKELMRANSISDPMKIKIGIVLQIPAKS